MQALCKLDGFRAQRKHNSAPVAVAFEWTYLGCMSASRLSDLVWIRRAARSGLARQLRLGLGLHLRELADELEVDVATLCRWENGLAAPRRDAALRWARLLRELEIANRSAGDEVNA